MIPPDQISDDEDAVLFKRYGEEPLPKPKCWTGHCSGISKMKLVDKTKHYSSDLYLITNPDILCLLLLYML